MPWRSVAVLLVVVAAAMAGNVQTQAQDAPKPVLVMSINNFDGLVGNLKYLGTVLEDAQYLSKLAKMTTHLTKGDTVDLEKAAGIDGTKPVIVYCRIGERSSHTWFVLTYLLGYPRVRNYDGSWTEWGSMVGVPIAKGPKPNGE